MQLPIIEPRLVHNARASRERPYGARERAILSHAAFRIARAEIASWPGYAPTPLVPLPGLAARLGLGEVRYKDESRRFHLGSFKALGGAYAVLTVLREAIRREGIEPPTAQDLAAGACREIVSGITVTAATDGNHGRSVAWGAQLFGCRCVIYLHEHVSEAREREIARFGPDIRRVPGQYDDSVRRCAADAVSHGRILVADTAGEEDAPVPALVMQGYTLLAQEILDAVPEEVLPTHVFVPAGVGGLAAALAAHWWEALGPARPRIIVVEPIRADCVFRSIAAGRPVRLDGDTDSFMACLAAGEVSAPAWAILEHGVDDVVALEDDAAIATMRLLAEGVDGDPPLVAGESGCAAAAAPIGVAEGTLMREALGLSSEARVVLIGSEGATDPETYERVVGRPAEAVAAPRETREVR